MILHGQARFYMTPPPIKVPPFLIFFHFGRKMQAEGDANLTTLVSSSQETLHCPPAEIYIHISAEVDYVFRLDDSRSNN